MPGDWGGILYLGQLFDPKVSKIEHASLHFGGFKYSNVYAGRCGKQVHGTIAIEGYGSYEGPAISDTLIENSATGGIVTYNSDLGDVCTTDYSTASVTFKDNAEANLSIGTCM
jgi:hypothetical protein